MCGGCQGLGGYSARCITQPGSLWLRIADKAESLGDEIGSNDITLANKAYAIAGAAKAKWKEAQG